jgi:hypothetical protein
MAADELSDAQYGLLFDVRRSVRHHDRRRTFFERLHRITGVLTILLTGSVPFHLAGTGPLAPWLQGIAVTAALLSAVDIVIGHAARANDHAALRARFVDLERALIEIGFSEEAWRAHRQARLSIERDEWAPIYRALDLRCHNELPVAEGFDRRAIPGHFAHLSAWQRLTGQWLLWPNIA